MSDAAAEPESRMSLFQQLRDAPADGVAWASFVRAYGPLVEAWCRRWGLQPADADDVTQTVLLKLAGHMRQFRYDPSQRFRGFLRTVARNVWADHVSDARREPSRGTASGAEALETLPAREDLASRLEEAFDRELLELAAGRVRARVEPHTWEAFRLTALEGKSGADAAAGLGMRVGTVFRARQKVQVMLREELERLEAEADT